MKKGISSIHKWFLNKSAIFEEEFLPREHYWVMPGEEYAKIPTKEEAKEEIKSHPEAFLRFHRERYPELSDFAIRMLAAKKPTDYFMMKYYEDDLGKQYINIALNSLIYFSPEKYFDFSLFLVPELSHKTTDAAILLANKNPEKFFEYIDLKNDKLEEIRRFIPIAAKSLKQKRHPLSRRAGEVIYPFGIDERVINEVQKELPALAYNMEENFIAGDIYISFDPNVFVRWVVQYFPNNEPGNRYTGTIMAVVEENKRVIKHKDLFFVSSNDAVKIVRQLEKYFKENDTMDAAQELAGTEQDITDENEKIPDNVVPFKRSCISKRAEEEITLNDTEKKIFDFLTEVVSKYNLGSTLRVAGGWVRDKVMGKESKDIDIAIDNMSGAKFAAYVEKLAKESGIKTNVGIVKANPDQSKHLETAVLHIFGESLDFVNLRTEKYDVGSRIPQIVATDDPKKDVLRRDLTINSLFYNINTNSVEDFTGKGISDIENGIIRTPIDPSETFIDDPLRILRAIRFATRYGFEIDPAIIEAAKQEKIQELFSKKVSRERMEIELRKMISGKDPRRAMELIKDMGLLSEIFNLPESYEKWDMDQQNPNHELTVWGHIMEALGNLQEIIKTRDISDADKFVLNLAAIMHDVGKLDPTIHGVKETAGQMTKTYKGHEEVSMSAAEVLLRNLPGITNKEIDRVKKLIDAARRVNPNYRSTSEVCDRTDKALRKFVKMIQEDWENAVDLAAADSSAHKKDWISSFDKTYFDTTKEKIRTLDPEKVRNMTPILNGNELMQLFGRKPGPWIGEINKQLMEWQMGNPNATKEDAAKFVKKVYDDLGIDKVAGTVGIPMVLRDKMYDLMFSFIEKEFYYFITKQEFENVWSIRMPIDLSGLKQYESLDWFKDGFKAYDRFSSPELLFFIDGRDNALSGETKLSDKFLNIKDDQDPSSKSAPAITVKIDIPMKFLFDELYDIIQSLEAPEEIIKTRQFKKLLYKTIEGAAIFETIDHELVHVVQFVMEISNAIYRTLRRQETKKVPFGLPANYDKETFMQYNPRGKNDSQQLWGHHLSDVEFFPKVAAIIETAKKLALEPTITGQDIDISGSLFHDHSILGNNKELYDLPQSLAKELISIRFDYSVKNFAGTFLKTLKENNYSRFKKAAREIYRAKKELLDMVSLLSSASTNNKLSKRANENELSEVKQMELWHGVGDPRSLEKTDSGWTIHPNPNEPAEYQKIWFAPAWNSDMRNLAESYAGHAMIKVKVPFEFVKDENGRTKDYYPVSPGWERSYQVQEYYLHDGPLKIDNSEISFVKRAISKLAGEIKVSPAENKKISFRLDRIPGGLAKNKSISDFNQKELMDGINVELEHTDDILIAMEIAMDHLTEDDKYYEKLKKVEAKISIRALREFGKNEITRLYKIERVLSKVDPKRVPTSPSGWKRREKLIENMGGEHAIAELEKEAAGLLELAFAAIKETYEDWFAKFVHKWFVNLEIGSERWKELVERYASWGESWRSNPHEPGTQEYEEHEKKNIENAISIVKNVKEAHDRISETYKKLKSPTGNIGEDLATFSLALQELHASGDMIEYYNHNIDDPDNWLSAELLDQLSAMAKTKVRLSKRA